MDTVCAQDNKIRFHWNTITDLAGKERVSKRERQHHDPKYRELAPHISPRPYCDRTKNRENKYRASTQDAEGSDKRVLNVNGFLYHPRIIGMQLVSIVLIAHYHPTRVQLPKIHKISEHTNN